MADVPVITIDGPSGSGKGAISLMLANKLNWNLLDSGSIYRLLALSILNKGLDENNVEEIIDEAKNLDISFSSENGDGELNIFLSGEKVNNEIKTEHCGNMASKLAVFSEVRKELLQKQRNFRKEPGLIADGRDMGTVVFPDAKFKFYLDASVEERAKRRYLQLKSTDKNVKFDNILNMIKKRDERDKNRVSSPLIPAKNAILLDTSGIGIQEVFDIVYSNIKQETAIFGGRENV